MVVEVGSFSRGEESKVIKSGDEESKGNLAE